MTESKNPRLSEGFVVTEDALRTALDEFRANLIAMTMLEAPPAPESQPLSAPAEKKEWITADDFLEHAYVTNNSSDGISTVECKCGITFLSQNEDYGRARKRHSDHRLIALNARLDLRIEAHIELAEVRAALKEVKSMPHTSTCYAKRSYGKVAEYNCDCYKHLRLICLGAREAELLARGGQNE